MSQGENGRVHRDVVLTVLQACGVSVTLDGDRMTLIDGSGTPEVQIVGEMIQRRLLHRFEAKFGVKIEYFFHPEMCCKGNDKRH